MRTLSFDKVRYLKFRYHPFLFLLYEVKREVKRISINGCRYNEGLNVKTEGSKRLVYTGCIG
jgi:hypothetical protein